MSARPGSGPTTVLPPGVIRASRRVGSNGVRGSTVTSVQRTTRPSSMPSTTSATSPLTT